MRLRLHHALSVLRKRRRLWSIPLGLATVAVAGWFGVPWLVPLPEALRGTEASPVLLDRHGEPLRHLTLPDFTRRTPVTLEQIPQAWIDATIAAEDKRFHEHGGIDLLATARAARDWATRGRAVSGASTITQQLVKIASPPRPRTLGAKVYEALAARRLEMSWSKEEILEAYFNRLNYGNSRIGPAEAVRFYFQKPLDHLSLGECALLAGLPQAPSRLNPVRHPERALARREVVLDRLAMQGGYEAAEIDRARAEPVRLRALREEHLAPWLPEMVGNTTRTTLDAALQREVERIVAEEIAPLRAANMHHIAVVVIDNPTGQILALVSSGDWDDPRGGRINGTLAPRSPGSALKPFTYLLSFRSGRSPASIVADIPTRFRTGEGLDAPGNFDRTFRGPVTLRHALACSLNVPAMRELNQLGGAEPLARLLRELDVLTPEQAAAATVEAGLGLTLGNLPVRLLDLTNAYATLARGGLHQAVTLDLDASPAPERIFDQTEAWLVADILADAAARAPAFGRGAPLELPFPCAVKTGTSSDFRDNWCLGFTERFTVGVWAGNFDHSPMDGVSGVAGAGPVFHRAMLALHRDNEPAWPVRPPELVHVRIDPRGGGRVGPEVAGSVMEWVPENNVPAAAHADDYDERGRLYLDATYAEWLASPHNRRRAEFAPAPNRPGDAPLRILSPHPGAVYVLDPELPNGGRLHLATNLPGLVEWSCDTLELSAGDPEPVLLLQPGRHILRATDPRNRATQELEIVVETY